MEIVLGLFNTIHLLLHYLLLPPLISWVRHPKFFEEEEEETLISPSQFFWEALGPPQNRRQRCFPFGPPL
jgi:hypothetical protein